MSGRLDDEALHDAYDRFLDARFRGEELDPATVFPDAVDGRDEIEAASRLAREVTESPAADQPPEICGYRILAELGHGGMGTVYLAEQERLNRKVALKVLPRSVALSRRGRRRFLEEARALARLEDEHIVAVHEVFEDGDVLAYAMEWVDGKSVRRLLDGLRGRDSVSVADLADELGAGFADLDAKTPLQFWLRTGAAIARALQVVHGAGIVHRDVKPGNLLIRKDGRAVLVDFGLAKTEQSSMSMTRGFVGTPIYAPPEQLRADELDSDATDDGALHLAAVDARADVYALAVTLYEALAGQPPYRGNTTTAVLRRIETGGAKRLDRAVSGVPRDLGVVLEKAMDPERQRRYATAAAFADDLERVLNLEPIQARRIGFATRAARRCRRNWRVLGAAACGAVAVLTLGAAWIAKLERDRALPHRVAGLVRQAHVLLLLPEVRRATWIDRQRDLITAAQFECAQTHRRAALGQYDAAIALGPTPRLLAERDAVRLALRLPEFAELDVDVARVTREFPALGRISDLMLRALLHHTPLVRASADGLMIRPIRLRRMDVADNLQEHRIAGLLAFLAGDAFGIEESWRELDQADADLPMLDIALAQIYQADGRPALALPRLQNAIAALPELWDLEFDLASIALDLGDVRTAARLLAGVHGRAGSTPRLRLLQTRLLEHHQPEPARDQYEELLAETPRDPAIRYHLAMLDWRLERVGAAVERLRELVTDCPDVAQFRLALARAALRHDDSKLYLDQASYVVRARFGRFRSKGEVRDLLDILQLGGLTSLYEAGMQHTHERGSDGVVRFPDAFWSRAGFESRAAVEATVRLAAE